MNKSNNKNRMSTDWIAEKGARYKGSEVCCPLQSAFPPQNKRQREYEGSMQRNTKSLQNKQNK